jgi:ABC-type sugar transport system ATPase subunit
VVEPKGTVQARIAAGLALVPEDRQRDGLVQTMSLRDNILIATIDRFTRGGLLTGDRERSTAAEKVKELSIRIPGLAATVTSLSGGNQQKVVLARWLLRHCRVLLLDEPTRGVDVKTKAELYRVIADLAGAGLGVLVVSSELEELVGICSRILVMREGELVAEVAGKDASERELLRHAVAPTESTDLVEEVV